MQMLKEIRDQLIGDIKTALPTLNKIDRYRGELEEGSEWNPDSEAVFVQVIGYKPRLKAADGTILKKTVVVRIYAGANTRHDKDALDIVEPLIDLFAGSNFEVDGNNHKIMVSDEGMELMLYEKGFEGYAFNIFIQ